MVYLQAQAIGPSGARVAPVTSPVLLTPGVADLDQSVLHTIIISDNDSAHHRESMVVR